MRGRPVDPLIKELMDLWDHDLSLEMLKEKVNQLPPDSEWHSHYNQFPFFHEIFAAIDSLSIHQACRYGNRSKS